MARIQLKIWRAPLATLQSVAPTGLAEGEIGIASETNTIYKRPDGNGTGALIPLGGGANSMRAKVVSTANVATLSGLLTVDGVTLLAGDTVLLTGQTTASQNGLYTASATAWARTAGADVWTDLTNALFVVEQGTANSSNDSKSPLLMTGFSPYCKKLLTKILVSTTLDSRSSSI
jgi:phage-related tail fiber protein